MARWYCRKGHRTFSLLPDCLASRLQGSLDEAEQVAVAVEAASSQEKAADLLRPDIELPGAVRWLRRRVRPLHAVLLALVTMMPGAFGATPTVTAVRASLGTSRALVAVRERAAEHLHALGPPLGFGPRPPP